jgi:hypothetical protein
MAESSEPKPGRRQVLQVLAGSVGAGLGVPALAAGEAPHSHGHADAPAAAQATGAPAAPLPTFLEQSDLAMLKSLAEAIVPGSTDAGVAAFVDQLLAVETRDRQRDFLAALGAIQSEALSRFGKSWMSLDAAQQTAVLTAASTGPRSREPRYWKRGEPVLVAERTRVPPTLRDRFELLKDRISSAYYSSEKGMKELGWTGQMVHPEFPGCTHPDGHKTGD